MLNPSGFQLSKYSINLFQQTAAGTQQLRHFLIWISFLFSSSVDIETKSCVEEVAWLLNSLLSIIKMADEKAQAAVADEAKRKHRGIPEAVFLVFYDIIGNI